MTTDNNTESLPSNVPAEIYIGFKSIFFGITCWSKGWFVESQIIDAQDKWGEIHKYVHHKEHEAVREKAITCAAAYTLCNAERRRLEEENAALQQQLDALSNKLQPYLDYEERLRKAIGDPTTGICFGPNGIISP